MPSAEVIGGYHTEHASNKQAGQAESKKPEKVRLIGSQLPLSGSPFQVLHNLQCEVKIGNPDFIKLRQAIASQRTQAEQCILVGRPHDKFLSHPAHINENR